MKNTVCLFLCIFTLTAFCQAPDFVWAKQMSGTGNQIASGISVDAAGNVYSTGFFEGLVDFDPGAGTYTLNSPGFESVYVSKVDAQGNFLWAKQLGGSTQLGTPFDTHSTGLSLGTGTSVIVTGFFEGLVDLDPGSALSIFYSSASSSAFILKLDLQGNYIWAKQFSTSEPSLGAGMITDANDNIYTSGFFSGSIDFDPGVGTYSLTSSNVMNSYVHKLDAGGNFVWATQINASIISGANSIALDASGNILLTGSFTGTIDLDPGVNSFTASSVAGSQDAYIVKLDPQANFIWAKTLGGNAVDVGGFITSGTAGAVYVTGNFSGSVDLDPNAGVQMTTSAGNYDIYLMRLDAQGNTDWIGSAGGSGVDVITEIVTDANGDIYCTGQFSNTVDFDFSANSSTLSAQNRNIFIAKYTSLGSLKWLKHLPGTSYGSGAAIAVTGNYDIFTTGSFAGSVDFDPGSPSFSLTAFGQTDSYVHKMKCGASPDLNISSSHSVSCAGASVTLSASGASTYSWNGTSAAANYSATPLTTTNFTVTGVDANACTSTIAFTQSVSACTGIEDASIQTQHFSIFPNPATESFNVLFENDTHNTTLEIYSSTGQLQFQQDVTLDQEVDVRGLAKGLYFVSLIENGQTVKTIKIVKD